MRKDGSVPERCKRKVDVVLTNCCAIEKSRQRGIIHDKLGVATGYMLLTSEELRRDGFAS